MAALELLVLGVGVAAVVAVTLAALGGRFEGLFTRVAVRLFGWSIEVGQRTLSPTAGVDSSKAHLLRGAHIAETYRVYAAKTYLYAGLVAVAAVAATSYTVGVALWLLGQPEDLVSGVFPARLDFLLDWIGSPELSAGEYSLVLLVSGSIAGVVAAVGTYQYRWYRPKYRGEVRERQIDTSLPWTVAFVYALSRSGMGTPEIMRVLAGNTAVYGEVAREIEIAVRDMDVFGTNVVSALWRLSERTPSEEFGDFAENFASVLQGGRDTSRFLREQYEQYQEAAEANQSQFLDLLATLAETYVTALVAGPLFLITTLVVIGFAIGNTLVPLRAIVYLGIPLATAGFLVYLDSITSTTTVESDAGDGDDEWRFLDVRSADDPDVAREGVATPDGGTTVDARFIDGDWYPEPAARNVGRLAAYNRLRGLRDRLRNPVGNLLAAPTAVLYAVVPIAALYVAARLYALAAAGDLGVATADDVAVHAVLLVVGPFALVYELHSYRTRRIERAVPDFLDRLASINEAGMPIVRSFERVRRSDLGALDEELDRTWTDIQMGAKLDDALRRLERRLNTPSVSRAVTLITHSMEASGDLAPVLRIAADEAISARRLKRRRRQGLLTYTIIIYVAFFVFLAIVVSLTAVFLPAVPTIHPGGGAGTPSIGVGGLSEAQKTSYQTVFAHAAVVQGVVSGLVAGKMSEGNVKAGAKHVTVMVAVAYGVIVLFV